MPDHQKARRFFLHLLSQLENLAKMRLNLEFLVCGVPRKTYDGWQGNLLCKGVMDMGLMNNILSKTGLGALAVGVALALSPMKADASTITLDDGSLVEGGVTTNSISIGDVYTMEISGHHTDVGGSFVWSFTATERLVALETNSLNPLSGFADAKVEWNSAANGTGTSFGSLSGSGIVTGTLLTEFAFNEEKFLIASWSDVTAKGSNFDLRLEATPIPLPAGGLLLLTALGGVAALRRKRKAV